MNALFLVFGLIFGFLLSRARATDYNTIINMFRFTDLHLAGVIMVAIVVAAIGLFLLRRGRVQALVGCAIEFPPRPGHRWMLAAGAVFGAGWALTGA